MVTDMGIPRPSDRAKQDLKGAIDKPGLQFMNGVQSNVLPCCRQIF